MANEKSQSTRESFNRFMGLGSYAGGVIVLGLMAFSLYSDGDSGATTKTMELVWPLLSFFLRLVIRLANEAKNSFPAH